MSRATLEPSPVFVMPAVERGQVVWWYPDGDTNQIPIPAIVAGKNPRSVNLNIIDENSYNFRCRDGVRHRSDPDSRIAEVREQGVWELTDRDKKLDELLKQMNLE